MKLLERLGLRPTENLGMKVEIRFSDGSDWRGDKQVLRNVTEIHYRYPPASGHGQAVRMAFESDVHGTGITYRVINVDEFEAKAEDRKAAQF